MKTRILPPTVIAAVIASVIVVPFLFTPDTRAQEAAAANTAQKWEYRALRIQDRRSSASGRDRDLGARKSASEDTLNQLGAEGWELVAVRNDGSTEPVFYFKRPKA